MKVAEKYENRFRLNDMKNCCALMFDGSNGLIVDPKGFTIGNYHDFKAFIAMKCDMKCD